MATTLPAQSQPRRNSLILKTEPASIGIIDTSTYSPFPNFPGSSSDRFGVNTYLLPPDSQSWAPLESSSPSGVCLAENVTAARGRILPGLRKQKSLTLSGISLLSPPVELHKGDSDVGAIDIHIKRSKSSESRGRKLPEASLGSLRPKSTMSLGKKSLIKVFQLGKPDPDVTHSSAPSAVSSSTSTSTSTSTPSLLTPAEPATPMTCRSTSDLSALSSASSTDSSEGVRTPSDTQPSITLASAKLAAALQDESKKAYRWRWFGKKGSRSVQSTVPPETATMGNTGAVDSAAISNSTASPLDARTSTRISQPMWTCDQLRRVSHSKLHQLRSPSPHPLALSLRRQHLNLPDEISLSLQEGRKVFPSSVNAYQPSLSGISPDNLRVLTGLKSVFNRLDQGQIPEQPHLRTQNDVPSKGNGSTPQGIIDFVKRPPFEDRMWAYYPGGESYVISMARRDYVIWDIEYSSHILALADGCERSMTVGPSLRLMSRENDLRSSRRAITVNVEEIEVDTVEFLVSPAVKSFPVEKTATGPDSVTSRTPLVRLGKTSSSQSWEWSDDDEDDDHVTLSKVLERQTTSSTASSSTQLSLPSSTSRGMTTVSSQSSIPSPLASSTVFPVPNRLLITKSRESDATLRHIGQQSAMEVVSSARARRGELQSGEVDRRVGVQAVRFRQAPATQSKQMTTTKSTSVSGFEDRPHSKTAQKLNRPSDRNSFEIPNLPMTDGRSHSFGPPDETTRAYNTLPRERKSDIPPARQPKPEIKRYHSFYEVPTHQNDSSLSLTSTHPSSFPARPIDSFQSQVGYARDPRMMSSYSAHFPSVYLPLGYHAPSTPFYHGAMYGSMVNLPLVMTAPQVRSDFRMDANRHQRGIPGYHVA